MELTYVLDDEGKESAVLIPIADWRTLTTKHKDLKDLEPSKITKKKSKPSDFVGTLSKEIGRKMIADIEESRNNWERNI